MWRSCFDCSTPLPQCSGLCQQSAPRGFPLASPCYCCTPASALHLCRVPFRLLQGALSDIARSVSVWARLCERGGEGNLPHAAPALGGFQPLLVAATDLLRLEVSSPPRTAFSMQSQRLSSTLLGCMVPRPCCETSRGSIPVLPRKPPSSPVLALNPTLQGSSSLPQALWVAAQLHSPGPASSEASAAPPSAAGPAAGWLQGYSHASHALCQAFTHGMWGSPRAHHREEEWAAALIPMKGRVRNLL